MAALPLPSLAALVALVVALTGTAAADAGRVVVYPAPSGQPLNPAYVVKVRAVGGDWRQLDVYKAIVDRDTFSTAAMVGFDAAGPVEVSVTWASGEMRTARVRPRSYGINATLDSAGRTATFTLPRPLDVSFEVNGNILENLHVFASPLETNVPKPGPRVIAFGPGLHQIDGDHVLRIPSNTTVYIAGGAVVQGSLDITNARNVVVRGRGIIDPSRFFLADPRPTIHVRDSTDVGIRDITLLRAQHAGVTIVGPARVAVSGLREITPDASSDGFNVDASTGVLLDDLFLRTSDDSIAVYASKWAGRGNTRNVVVRNSTLWADRAHAFFTGVHGNPSRYEVIEHLEVQNVDVLEHDEFRSGDLYQGALAANAGNRVTVRDVRFEDVRVEDFSRGQVVSLKVFRNPAYNTKAGWRVDRVLLRNVSYDGQGDATSRIQGYNPIRQVTNVTFENLVRNGRTVLDPVAGNIEVGPYASNIVFRRQQATRTVPGASDAIRYTGRWQRTPAAGSHARDLHTPLRAGSKLMYSFAGRQARVYGRTGPASGKVDVAVDGRTVATVDTYSAVSRARQIWFDTGVLASRRHTIELRYRGARNVLANGAAVGFDSLEIVK